MDCRHTEAALKRVCEGESLPPEDQLHKTKLGSDATAAAGPSGATCASSSVGGADVLTYARAKGLFAGVSLEGATLHQDVDANKPLYGKAMTGRDIVTGRGIETPSGGKPLVSLLNAKTSK